MRAALKLIGACFLTAAFVFLFYLAYHDMAYKYFESGYEYGRQQCVKPGALTLPDTGEIEAKNLEPGTSEAVRNRPST